MRFRLTEKFFRRKANEPFFPFVQIGVIYNAKLASRGARGYRYLLIVTNVRVLTPSPFGNFQYWYGMVPVSEDEVEYIA